MTTAAGMALLALASEWASFGYGLVLLVPFTIGWSLGYGANVRSAFKVILWTVLIVSLLAGALTLEIAGVLCTLVLAAIILGPAMIGMIIGHVLRKRLARSRVTEQRALSIALFLPALAVLYAEARLDPTSPVEVVEASRTFDLPAREVWSRLAFYEEIQLPPPPLARIGLPHPLYTRGAIGGVGDRKTCVYDKGFLVKRITRFEPGRELAFDVVAQEGIEDRSVELLDGSFRLEETSEGTVVTLTTRYRPLLSARAFWRPFEHALTRALHEHVLEGMAR